MTNLSKLIEPKSIAIIGASNNPEKIGYQIVNNIISSGFKGKLYPINPKQCSVMDLDAYKSIKDIKKPIDLAIIVIPFQFVLEVVNECIAKKVSAIAIISSGFAETGEEGEKAQEEIKNSCEKNGILLLGPNCLGIMNTDINLNASFSNSTPERGHVSLISQSGAMICALTDWSKSEKIGFSKIISLGNKAQLSESDFLEYLYKDPNTKVISAYLEEIKADSKLTEILIKNAHRKPTIVLFGGKTAFGTKAALSHTGSIISSYLAVETYFKQAGVLLASDLAHFFTLIKLFSIHQNINGKNICLVTNAGGPSIAACDAIFKENLTLGILSEKSKKRLGELFRPEANLANPIDLLGDATAEDYKNAIEIALNDNGIDSIIALITRQSSTDIDKIAETIASFKNSKPIITCMIGGENLRQASEIIVNSGKICFSYPEDAVFAMSELNKFKNVKNSLLPVRESKKDYKLSEKDRNFKIFDLPLVAYKELDNIAELFRYADEIGYPVVLKTADSKIIHKTEGGNVILNIKDENTLQKAYEKIGPSVLIGKMIKGNHELFLGVKRDANIGVMIAFGTGGIYSEIYNDFSYRIAPVDIKNASTVIKETKIGQILQGARGQTSFDLNKLAKLISNTSRFIENFHNISEIDFNPIIANKEGYFIADARIILKEDSNDKN